MTVRLYPTPSQCFDQEHSGNRIHESCIPLSLPKVLRRVSAEQKWSDPMFQRISMSSLGLEPAILVGQSAPQTNEPGGCNSTLCLSGLI